MCLAFKWSFLFVFIALVTLTVGNARKVARRQKAEFHRRVADLGEEAALKSVMHGELPSWVSFPDKASEDRHARMLHGDGDTFEFNPQIRLNYPPSIPQVGLCISIVSVVSNIRI